MSATLFPPRQFARSLACAMLVTSRLVSPKLSAMSQTGTSVPIKLPEWITGRSFVPWAMPKRQCVLGMGMDDGHDVRPRREYRRMNEALEIKAAPFITHRLSV